LLVAVAGISPGCGGGEDEEPQAGGTATPAAEESALLGTYTTTLGAETVRNPPDPGVQTPSGEWRLEITDAGATLTDPAGNEFPPGDPIEISEEEIVFAPDPECPVQEGTPGEGTYEWRLEGSTLTLTEVDDSCRDRAFVLTAQSLVRTEQS
jgi:hypothetical protein